MAGKTKATLTQTRIADGWWEGVLTGAGEPVEAWHLDRQLEGVETNPTPGKTGQQAVRVPIPAFLLTEGVQTVVLRVAGEVLASFTLVAGAPLDQDLRAEIGLLRAELDLLKRAFRRHCSETAG